MSKVTLPQASVRLSTKLLCTGSPVAGEHPFENGLPPVTPFSISVGATHWEETSAGEPDIPGPKPEFFFAPGQAAKRVEDWGPAELQSHINRAYLRMVDQSTQWLRIEHRQGPEGIEDTYRDLLEGRAEPSSGFVCSMHTGHLS